MLDVQKYSEYPAYELDSFIRHYFLSSPTYMHVVIPISPVPAGRPRFTRQGHAYDPKKSRVFKRQVAMYVSDWISQHGYKGKIDAPKEIYLIFYRPNQKHISKKDYARREKNQSVPIVKPDVDKLC